MHSAVLGPLRLQAQGPVGSGDGLRPGDTVVIAVDVACESAEPAWLESLSLQARGLEHVEPAWVQPRNVNDRSSLKGDYFLFRTVKNMIPKGRQLQPGEIVRFTASFTLPTDCPPTFRGVAVRYSYDVQVRALQAADGTPLIVTVPLRVWTGEPTAGMGHPLVDTLPGPLEAPVEIRELPPDSSGAAKPLSVQGMGVSDRSSPLVGTGLHEAGLWQPQGGSHSSLRDGADEPGGGAREEGGRTIAYNVQMGESPLVKVSLRRPAPQCTPGCTVAGSLDFSASHGSLAPGGARCLLVTVAVETEEAVHSGRAVSQRVDAVVQRRVLDEFTEATADTLHTGFVFTLPDDSTPTFTSSAVSFRWALQFEFHVAVHGATPNRYGCIPSQLLKWGIPLTVASPPRLQPAARVEGPADAARGPGAGTGATGGEPSGMMALLASTAAPAPPAAAAGGGGGGAGGGGDERAAGSGLQQRRGEAPPPPPPAPPPAARHQLREETAR